MPSLIAFVPARSGSERVPQKNIRPLGGHPLLAYAIRAVELVKQHPGKMWMLDDEGRTMRPLLEQNHLDSAWHAGQYQALPKVYTQNSALEIAWTRVVSDTGTREGRVIAPFLTE